MKINVISVFLNNGEPLGNFAFGKNNPHSFLLKCGDYDRKREVYVLDRGFELGGPTFKLVVYPGFLVKVKE